MIKFSCLISLLVLLVSAFDAEEKVNLNLGKGNMMLEEGCFDRRRVNLMPDVGWYHFAFDIGNSGKYAFQTFYFNLPVPSQLVMTDCFCGGDSFVAYESYDSFNRVIDASHYGCETANESCNFYNTDPNYCSSNFGWCSGISEVLYPGFHNITIMIARSPFQAGTGFIQLNAMCKKDCGVWVPCCTFDDSCNNSIYQKSALAAQKNQ